MKRSIKIVIALAIIINMLLPIISLAITEIDNGIMHIYPVKQGDSIDGSWLSGFDINGYIMEDESSENKSLISSTYHNYGYHVFLNVNGKNGEMQGIYKENEEKMRAMHYSEIQNDADTKQNIDGIDILVTTEFINDGEQLKINYELKNTTSATATFSLGTAADVQIDGDDDATIQRLEDKSGIQLWTADGNTEKPVQFVLYAKDVQGVTDVDNIWIGSWGGSDYLKNIFNNNEDINKIENKDSAMAFSWVNRTIAPGETKRYSVLMEVGEINVPNTGIILDNNTKFYYSDVKINGSVIDKDLKDNITIHYTVDGIEYTLPPMATTGNTEEFELDLTSLNLSAGTEHTLKVWATDSLGFKSNEEERIFTVTYLKNPELGVSTEEWSKDNVTFRITDIKNTDFVKNYQYRINNSEWVNCEKDKDIPISESGIVNIEARIEGSKENDFSDIISKQAKIDHISPTTTKPTTTPTTCTITVNATQTDEHSGIDSTKTLYAIKKGEVWSEWQSSNTFTGLTHNTEYIVKTKSTDKVGNSSESEELAVKTEELKLGNLILKINNSEGENYTEDTWTNKNIYIAIQEVIEGATTTYQSKENSSQVISKTNQETTVTKDGITTIVLSVTDGTNTITSDVEHILKIDKIAPTINKLFLDNEEWSLTEKNVTGIAIDTLSGITSYQFSKQENITISSSNWNSITNTTSEITQSTKVSDNGKIYFGVMDIAGNVAVVGIDTKIDVQKPVITFQRANGKTTINVTDTGAGVEKIQYVWTDSDEEPTESEFKDYSNAVTYDGTSKDKIYLWAKARDKAGNETIESCIFNRIKEPQIISENEFINKYIAFKLNSENEDKDIAYQFKINNDEWMDITEDSIHTITNIKEGNVKISARVIDNAGRYSEITNKTVKVSIVEEQTNNKEENNSGNAVNNNSSSNQQNGGNNASSSIQSSAKDGTLALGNLPKTGINKMIAFTLIAIFIIFAIFTYKKFKSYKDIK